MQVKIRFCELLFVEECFHEEKCGYSLSHNMQPLNHEALVCPQDTHATGIRGLNAKDLPNPSEIPNTGYLSKILCNLAQK